MKKSLVAVSVIVALGVVWTGSSWYIGKQLEAHMAERVQQANNELNKALPEAGIVLSYENYQRGLFTSQMQLVVKNAPESQNPVLKPDQSIVFNETLSHGPLPGLTHFSFIPAMASVHSELAKNSTTQPLFDITKDQSLINAVTRVAFDGATSSVISLIPVDYSQDNVHFVFSGSTLEADVDAHADKMTFAFNANSGSIKTVNEAGQPVQVSYKGISFASDSQTSIADLRIGKQKVGIQNVVLNVDGKDMGVLDDLLLSAITELQADKKNLSLQADYSLAALKVQSQNLGSGKLAFKLNNLDAQALSEVSKAYTVESQKLLADPEVIQDPERYRQEMVDILVSKFPLLLKGNPSLSIAPLSWKNAKGESTFTLALALKDPQNAATPAESAEAMLGQYLASLDTHLVIPIDMAIQLMSQVAQLDGSSAENAEKLATQQVKSLAAMGQMFHITKVENNSITASLNFADNKATLNGEPMPLSDLFSALPLGLGSQDEEDEAPGVSEPDVAPQQ